MKTKNTTTPRFGYENHFDVKFLTDLADLCGIAVGQWRKHTAQEISDMLNCMKSLRAARDEIKTQGYATCVNVSQCILVTLEILCKAGVKMLDVRGK